MKRIVGRKAEQKLLNKLYQSKKAEFLAIYGRRRVGKTYLVNEFFKFKGVFFEITGSINATVDEQVLNFHREFCALFTKEDSLTPPANWSEAFHRLQTAIASIKHQKVTLFFDELPWLSAGKSDFLSALDYFWNRHLSKIPNVILIVSGSAASWMIRNVIHNTGGLYGRLSAHIRLLPFTLAEVREYLIGNGIDLPLKQICEIYMVTGGVPKYLSYIEPGLSSAQVIHSLCFSPQSPLITEFHKLYRSLFKNSEIHLEVIKVLAQKRSGLTRKELLSLTSLPKGGATKEVLEELEESGFLITIQAIGKKVQDRLYLLSDEYSLFYLTWIDNEKGVLLQGVENDYWIKRQSQQSWKSWSGFAFESICLKHIKELKEALGISGVTTDAGYWRALNKGKKQGEIDLVIDRADQCINLCEVKFHNSTYSLTKEYAEELLKKKELFREKTKTSKALFSTLITPFGAKENENYLRAVDHQLTLEDLFE